MANVPDVRTTSLIKDLIVQMCGFTVDTKPFKEVEKRILRNIQVADSLYFGNRPEIDTIVESLANKFILHGLILQAKQVLQLYEKLVPKDLKKEELAIRLNIIKFLLGVSQSPTNNLHKLCKNSESLKKSEEDDIVGWAEYLLEGIPRWTPPPDEDSDSWSESNNSIVADDHDAVNDCSSSDSKTTYETCCEEQDVLLLYRNSKTNLLKSVQSDWFNNDQVIIKPVSQDRDANIAILWDDFISQTTWGLIPDSGNSILTEYKVMREILWQFHQPHTSSCFNLIGNKIVPSENVTISSVRSRAFYVMLLDVVPYINWLDVFRDFTDSLINSRNKDYVAPDTYRSYSYAIQTILMPVFNSLRLIEDKIKSQDNIHTLLTSANETRFIFKTVQVLHNIHKRVILDFKTHSPFECATTLLWRLRHGLLYTSSKLEHNIYLALYLTSLCKYFTIINSWLSRDEFVDRTGEFIISNENPKEPHVVFDRVLSTSNVQANGDTQNNGCSKVRKGEQDWHMRFIVKETTLAPSDGILDIICTQVLQIGKNIHLLHLLGKLHLVPEFTGKSNETLYKTFIRRVLEQIDDFFEPNGKGSETLTDLYKPITEPNSFIFPAICPDGCKYYTKMDKLENLIDTSDGFLIKAFESFFIKKPEYKDTDSEKTLYERISKVAVDFFPSYEMIENVFITILKEQYKISGIMVKNVLVNDYNLEKQFSLLRHMYLFEDDLFFPVYRHIFDELDNGSIWNNHSELTSHLQDIVMDACPDFYDKCIVHVKDTCEYTRNPLKVCCMVTINYKISWPVNIILRDEHMLMYNELFQFILIIKWSLYTLNHMFFRELEPRAREVKKSPKSVRSLTAKLKMLRFGLVNIFSSIQHYILGHVFTKHLLLFQKAFDEACDLDSLVSAHSNFIQSLHKEYCSLRDYNKSSHGIYLLLYTVIQIRHMWRNLPGIIEKDLDSAITWFLLCREVIEPIVNPTSYYNFVSKH